MKKRLCAIVAVMLWLGLAAVSPAQDAAAAGQKPLVTVSFAGYDQVMSVIQKVTRAAGQPELAKIAEGMVAQQAKGLPGLDKTRPWGLVVYASDDGQFHVQAFVPVTDLKQLMSLLPMPMTPDAAGVYALPINPAKTFYVAQKGQWAFIVDSKGALNSVPADPSALLGDLSKKYLMAVRSSPKNLPATAREKIVAQAKMANAMEQGPQPFESAEEAAIRTYAANLTVDVFATLAKDLDGATLGLGLDPSTGAAYLDCELVAQPGTKTAQQFAALQDTKTNFAGLQVPGAAVTAQAAGALDAANVAKLKAVSARVRATVLDDIEGNTDLDAAQKQSAKQVLGDALDVLDKTIEGRKIDAGLAVTLEAGATTAVGGLAVADGAKLDRVLRAIVAEAAKEQYQFAKAAKLDAARHEGVTFHVTTIPVPDPDAAKVFGEQLDIVVGTGGESLYVGAGKNALATLQQVVDTSKREAGKAVPALQLVVTGGPYAKLIAQVAPPGEEQTKMAAGTVSQVLAASGGKDHATLIVRSIPNGVSMRLSVEEGLLKSGLGFIPTGGGPGGPPGAKPAPPAGRPAGGNAPF